MIRPGTYVHLSVIMAVATFGATGTAQIVVEREAAVATPLAAPARNIVNMPLAGIAPVNQIRMTVETDWSQQSGYRPIFVTLAPTVPQAMDRSFSIVASTDHNRRPNAYSVRATTEVLLPAGRPSVRVKLQLPEYSQTMRLNLDVYEDEYRLKELSGGGYTWYRGRNAWSRSSQHALPAILVVTGSRWLPSDWTQLALAVQVPEEHVQFATTDPAEFARGIPNWLARHPDELPTEWIDFTCFDVVIVSMGDVVRWVENSSAQWNAIRRWAASGGNLFIHGAGENWGHLPEIEMALRISRSRNATGDASSNRGWKRPPTKLAGGDLAGVSYFHNAMVRELQQQAKQIAARTNPGNAPPRSPIPGPLLMQAAQRDTTPLDLENPGFQLRKYDMGMVVVFAQSDLFPGRADEWAWVFNSLGPERWRWSLRNGVSYVTENSDFWDFLIPGVGLPPVISFLILITVFVLLIGPVNFIFLYRRRQLNLLLVTIPLAAGVVTVSLFGYAVLADGLGVRLRARTFTHIDQTRGEVVAWARLSYYAGLAPSAGLTMPADTAVLPIEPRTGRRAEVRSRDLHWEAGQRLVRGWLRSRNPEQFMTIRAADTNRGLRVTENLAAVGAGQKGNITIENRLGTEIQQLILSDSTGCILTGSNIPAGNVRSLTEVSAGETKALNQAWRTIFKTTAPRPLQADGYDYREEWQGDVLLEPAVVGDDVSYHNVAPAPYSRLETSLRKVLRWTGQTPIKLPARNYVAVVSSAPEVALGVESPDEEGSLHVVFGRW